MKNREEYRDFIAFVNSKTERLWRNRDASYNNMFRDLKLNYKAYNNIIDMLNDIEDIIDDNLILDVYISLFKYTDTIYIDNNDAEQFLRVRINVKNTDNFEKQDLEVLTLKHFNIIDSNFIINNNEPILDYTETEKSNIRKSAEVLSTIYTGMESKNIKIPDFDGRYFILSYKNIQ